MIRPLCQRHRRMVIALGIFLPVVFAVGIAARKPVPTVGELPAALAITVSYTEIVLASRHATMRYFRGAPCLKLKQYVRHIHLWRQRAIVDPALGG